MSLLGDYVREIRKSLFLERGFAPANHGNYKRDGVTIGIVLPKTHALPCPTDDSIGTRIDGVRVLKLDGLIEAKRIAVMGLMKRIALDGYRSGRKKAAIKHLKDFLILCRELRP